MEQLRDEIAELIDGYRDLWDDGIRVSLTSADCAASILSIPTIKEALAFHESCKSAFKVNGEFVVTEANVVGKGGVSAS